VRAVVVVGPRLAAAPADTLRTPDLASKPVLIVLPQQGPRGDRAPLEDTAWPLAAWLSPPGDTEAFLQGPCAPGVAAWALGATRVVDEHSVLSSDAPRA
jgi:hypothetical protein